VEEAEAADLIAHELVAADVQERIGPTPNIPTF
jgi:hypothetical protein